MTARNSLPTRRPHEVLTFQHAGLTFTGGAGRFADGSLAEVFVNGAKFGSAAEASAQEAALAVSLALQHGCSVQTITHALTRNGVASGPVGALLLAIEAAR